MDAKQRQFEGTVPLFTVVCVRISDILFEKIVCVCVTYCHRLFNSMKQSPS